MQYLGFNQIVFKKEGTMLPQITDQYLWMGVDIIFPHHQLRRQAACLTHAALAYSVHTV
jgi:hypothetical protein